MQTTSPFIEVHSDNLLIQGNSYLIGGLGPFTPFYNSFGKWVYTHGPNSNFKILPNVEKGYRRVWELLSVGNFHKWHDESSDFPVATRK